MREDRQDFLVQLLLKEFPRGLRTKEISQFLGIDHSDLNGILRKMCADRLIEQDGSASRWMLLRHPRACQQDWKGEDLDSPAEKCLCLLAESDALPACTELYAYLQDLTAKPLLSGVAVCLDILISRLRSIPYEKMHDSSLRSCLDLILKVQGDSFSLGVRMQLAQTLSSVAYAVAEMLGDERARALINIMDGCLRYHSGREYPAEMNKLLDDGLSAIRALGDIDIETQIKYFLSFLYYEKGDYKACYEAFDAAQNNVHAASCQYFNMLYPIYLAPAAYRVGQYAQCIGVCDGALREARRNGDRYKELWLTTTLAVQFLQIGASEQGIALLTGILDCTDAESSSKLHLWVWRALALYHMQMGRTGASCRLLAECVRQRMRLGQGRFAYTSEWILEMLEGYERAHLPPVPEYGLDRELERVLMKQDRHLHGMAFRIKAHRLPPESRDERILLLRSSMEAFQECGDRREAARSSLELAEACALAGRNVDVGLAESARSTLMEMTLSPATTLPHLAPWQGLVYATEPHGSLERCLALLRGLDLTISAEACTGMLLSAVQRELGAERAALCRLLPNGGMAFIAGSNMAAEECSPSHFAEGLRALDSAAAQRWTLVPSGDNVLLCLRLDDFQKDKIVLFLESAYVAGAFVSMDAAGMQALADTLGRELSNLLRLQSQHKKRQESHPVEYVMPNSERIEYDDSPGYQRILEQAKYAAQTDAPILILGETGVGKEVLAKQIHTFSGRPGMFVPVNPASTPENLFESEFFGYEKGAFTGAQRQKIGFFELADNGTFFIDELAEIPMSFQVKFLRVLQDHSFTRVGGIRYITSNFRLVCATNKNLWQEVQEGRFREDLYYRLSVIPIRIPPLRKRQQDIPRLLNLFVQQFSQRYGRKIPPLQEDTVEQCRRYAWPGNIREMRNIVERAVILNTGGPLRLFLSEQQQEEAPSLKHELSDLYADLPTLEELSVRYMRYVLEKTEGKVIGEDGAETILGVKRSTLYTKLRKYGLK